MNRNLTGLIALVTGSVYGIDFAMAKEPSRPFLQSLNITQSFFTDWHLYFQRCLHSVLAPSVDSRPSS